MTRGIGSTRGATGPAAAGGGGAALFVYALQSCTVSTTVASAVSKLGLGAVRFDPSVLPESGALVRHVYFEAILSTSNEVNQATIDLYNFGAGAIVASSELATGSLVAAFMSVELPALASLGPAICQARLWMEPKDPANLMVVTCSYAALVVKLL